MRCKSVFFVRAVFVCMHVVPFVAASFFLFEHANYSQTIRDICARQPPLYYKSWMRSFKKKSYIKYGKLLTEVFEL